MMHVEAHAFLFDAMHQTVNKLKLSKELVEDLKRNGMKEIRRRRADGISSFR